MSSRPLSARVAALADLPLFLVGAWTLALLIRSFQARVGHPYDLEWMEGGMLVHGLRVAQGQPLYVRPTAEFIPFIYPPLYPWILGLLGRFFGITYALGRTISLVGTFAGAGALAVALRREGAGALLALGAAALFLGTYEDAGTFFDLVRNDGLLIGLLGWSLVAVRAGWLRSGALLLVLAFATKHNAALFGLPSALWLLRYRGRPQARRYVVWSVLPALAFTIGMCFEGDGLFLTYLLQVPATHPIVWSRLFPGSFREMVLGGLPLAAALALLAGFFGRRRPWSEGAAWWVAQGGTAILLSAVMRAHFGGYTNVLIPGLWALALWGGLAAVFLRRRWPGLPVAFATGLLLAVQGWIGLWPLERYLPSPEDVTAGDAVVARLSAIEGEILSPYAPWLAVQAGHAPGFHLIALWDIDHPFGPLVDAVDTIDTRIAAGHFAAIVAGDRKFGHGLLAGYRSAGNLLPRAGTMGPVTGWSVRPRYLYLPKEVGAPEGEE